VGGRAADAVGWFDADSLRQRGLTRDISIFGYMYIHIYRERAWGERKRERGGGGEGEREMYR